MMNALRKLDDYLIPHDLWTILFENSGKMGFDDDNSGGGGGGGEDGQNFYAYPRENVALHHLQEDWLLQILPLLS